MSLRSNETGYPRKDRTGHKECRDNSVEISLTYTYIKPQRLIHDTKIMTSKHVTMLPAVIRVKNMVSKPNSSKTVNQ